MTTSDAYRATEEIRNRIRTVRSRHWLVRIATGIAALLAATAGSVLLLGGALGFWPDQPPVILRWALLGLTSLVVAGALGWLLLRGVFWRCSQAQTARLIEQALPEVRNDLINAILLSEDAQQVSPELVQQAIYESRARCERVNLLASVGLNGLKRWALAAGLAVTALAAFAILQPGVLARALVAARPSAYVPHLNALELKELSPGDATIFLGEPVTIRARIAQPPDGKELPAEVLFPDRPSLAMHAGGMGSTYTLPMGPAEADFRYAVRIGGSRWPADRPWYSVQVLPQVEITGLSLVYHYPPYLHGQRGPAESFESARGPIEAPLGTRVVLTVRTSQPVPQVLLDRREGGLTGLSAMSGHTRHRISFPIEADGAYRLLLQDTTGKVFQQLPDAAAGGDGYFPITAVADSPPRVEFIEPGRDVTAAPGQTVRMRLRAGDAYGLRELRLEAEPAQAIPGRAPGRKMLSHEFALNGRRELLVEYDFTVPDDLPDDGSVTIVYYATASDNRSLGDLGGPQTRTSRQFKIRVQDVEELAARRARTYQLLRKRLMDLLGLQAHLRVSTGICRTAETQLPELQARARDIRRGQAAVEAELVDLATQFPFDKDLLTLQKVCLQLARQEAPLAVAQAEVLATIAALDRRDGPCANLATTQDRIIDSLQTLLAIMPSLANRPEPKDPARGEDLPPETQAKLRDLQEKLKQFVEAQKKVVEATERLSKKPVDDFTAEDDKLLKDLQATQDKWEKFLNEAFTDLSKMAEQDFANPTLIKEVVSIKTDVTMAKDALKAKATEIATAAEDNGIENAKSLTANIEKWLPDKPDRENWNMEDPADGQTNTEQAELPDQLEDLVGDLLEEEEDLFDQMQDLTSKYNMSGDKGIGWDAMDGPISNMNAQGVTGNQLPNSNEMSGRSGEGRQGKATGEMVENKAVGKGGRRTPTRLSPEPFQKGQVDDQSSEPAGGATGGGKVSGAGADGLEGPVPAEMKKEMRRLAGKQADLINRAERHRAGYAPGDYRNFELEKTIKIMRQVQSDLENYRYRNVLRARKDVVSAIGQTNLLLTGKVHVAEDTSAEMPKYLRDVADTTDRELPAEYRDALRQYYQRLSELHARP